MSHSDDTMMDAKIYDIQMTLQDTTAAPIASLYHERSKRFPSVVDVGAVPIKQDLLRQCALRSFKRYCLAKVFSLPEPTAIDGIHLNDLILGRRTLRQFHSQPVTSVQLGTLMALSYRVKSSTNGADVAQRLFTRPIPSGGALYPLELYLATLNTQALPEGLYHYHPLHHGLELLDATQPRSILEKCAIQGVPHGAALAVCICGVLPRTCFKYGELGYRLLLLEAGHLAQNILLVAGAIGLGALPYCGFFDDRIHDYLGVDGVDEVCLYLLWLGWPSEESELGGGE